MIETVLLAFLVAKIKHFKIRPVFKDWSIYPVLLCTLGYIYLESTVFRGDYSLVKYAAYFKLIYFSSVLILALRHKLYKVLLCSIPLIWIGSILNTVAIRFNHSKMPVFPSSSWSTGLASIDGFNTAAQHGDLHVIGDMNTHLIPLTDVWDFGFSIFSIGDLIIRAFVFIIIFYSIKEQIK